MVVAAGSDVEWRVEVGLETWRELRLDGFARVLVPLSSSSDESAACASL